MLAQSLDLSQLLLIAFSVSDADLITKMAPLRSCFIVTSVSAELWCLSSVIYSALYHEDHCCTEGYFLCQCEVFSLRQNFF